MDQHASRIRISSMYTGASTTALPQEGQGDDGHCRVWASDPVGLIASRLVSDAAFAVMRRRIVACANVTDSEVKRWCAIRTADDWWPQPRRHGWACGSYVPMDVANVKDCETPKNCLKAFVPDPRFAYRSQMLAAVY
jgi:hypothetical protein